MPAVRTVVTFLSWLSVPAAVLAVAGVWLLTRRAEMLACTGTAVCVQAWTARYVMDRMERLVGRHQDQVHVRQSALIKALDVLASGPADPAAQEPSLVRAA